MNNDILEAQRAVSEAKRRLDAAVAEARAQGETWAQIGETLNMSRQAAFKRFGKVSDPRNGEDVPRRSVSYVADVTEQAVTLIAAGKYEKLRGLMHDRVARELPPDVIASTWQQVLKEVGSLEECVQTHVELPDGTTLEPDDRVLGTVVGVTTVKCEAGDVLARVAVNEDLEIVGLLLVPPDHGELPF